MCVVRYQAIPVHAVVLQRPPASGVHGNTCAREAFSMISSLEQVGTKKAVGTPAYIRLQETVAAITADDFNYVINKLFQPC